MADRSLLEQARSNNPGLSDEQLVVLVASELLDFLECEPPVNPAMVASLQGIGRIDLCDLPWAGCLVNEGREFVIRVRASDPSGRRRFTTFHEIAHTFLPGFEHQMQYRCSPDSTRKARDRNEQLCDLAASEMLLPGRHVAAALADLDFGLDAVEVIAEDFDASLEATARRVTSLAEEPTLFIRLELRTKPSDPAGKPKLRVASSLATGKWPFIPAHKSVGAAHVLNECLEGGEVRGVSDIDGLCGSAFGDVELHARSYPFTDSEGEPHVRVLALARPHR